MENKEIELFKKCFIDDELSAENLIIVKNSLFELRDNQSEKILAEYIDEKLSLLSNNELPY